MSKKKSNSFTNNQNKSDIIEQIIRVNHAGEYGAKRIYEGQLAVLNRNNSKDSDIRKMLEQEKKHLKYFEEEIASRQIRPTALQPIWHITGFMLGAATAMAGREAAMACTVAVEEVIDEHYSSQLEELDESEEQLKSKINQFRKEELMHRDLGLQEGAEKSPGYDLMVKTIKTGSKLAIWLSKRI